MEPLENMEHPQDSRQKHGKPEISVVVPIKNRPELLQECLESIRRQTIENWECLMVDDGSDEQTITVQMAAATSDPRFRMVKRSEAKSGGNVCRNAGWQAAKAPWIVFLDSDDLLAPWALEGRLKHCGKDTNVLVNNAELFHCTPGDKRIHFNVPRLDDPLDRFLSLDFLWQTTGPTWPRKLVEAVGGFDERLPSWQDWEFFVRSLIVGIEFRVMGKCDFYYRSAVDENVSSKATRDLYHLNEGVRLMTRIERLLVEHSKWTLMRSNLLELLRRHLAIQIMELHGIVAALSISREFPGTRQTPFRLRMCLHRLSNLLPQGKRHDFIQRIWKQALSPASPTNQFIQLGIPELLASEND